MSTPQVKPEVTKLQESFLWMIESNPSDAKVVLGYFDVEVVKSCQLAKWVYFEPRQAIFFLTASGALILRSLGRNRRIATPFRTKVSDQESMEMSPERAIALFGGEQSTEGLIDGEGRLVNGTPPKPIRYPEIPDFKVTKKSHLPKRLVWKKKT